MKCPADVGAIVQQQSYRDFPVAAGTNQPRFKASQWLPVTDDDLLTASLDVWESRQHVRMPVNVLARQNLRSEWRKDE